MHTTIALVFLLLLNLGLAVLFYTPEQGFAWFWMFSGLSLLVLAGLAALIYYAGLKAKQGGETDRGLK